MATVSKTAAIRDTRNTISIHGSRTNWTIIGPYRVSEWTGPSTEFHADSYTKARKMAAAWRAEVVLAMIGKYDDESRYAVQNAADDYKQSSDLQSLIAVGVAAYGTGQQYTAAQKAQYAAEYWDSVSQA